VGLRGEFVKSAIVVLAGSWDRGKMRVWKWNGQGGLEQEKFVGDNMADAENRSFLARAYPTMKKNNPHTPIMLREAAGTQPRVYARYGQSNHPRRDS
jgi:hypothetical protein